MWQSSNRPKTTTVKKKSPSKISYHLRRVTGELKTPRGMGRESTIIIVRVLLNDLTPTGLELFSPSPLMVGDVVALTLEQPSRIFLKGKIGWCAEVDHDSRILSATPYSFRAGMQFVFENVNEENSVREFCEMISESFLGGGGLPQAA